MNRESYFQIGHTPSTQNLLNLKKLIFKHIFFIIMVNTKKLLYIIEFILDIKTQFSEKNNIFIPESFNMNISHQLF